jgi:hypothetical protein
LYGGDFHQGCNKTRHTSTKLMLRKKLNKFT